MDALTAGLLVLVVLIVMLALRVHVGLALILSGLIGILSLDRPIELSDIVSSVPYDQAAQYSWLVIPMFIFMGMLAGNSGMITGLFEFSARVFRHLPGAIGLGAIGASAGFAAISGSSVAAAAAIGRMTLKEMLDSKYRPEFAAGIVAAGGTLGVLIPPSVVLVVYAIAAGESVGQMLIAGVVPGFVTIAAFVTTILIRSRSAIGSDQNTGALAVPTSSESFRSSAHSNPSFDVGEGAKGVGALRSTLRIAVLFVVVVLGIYLGLYTATEAAALGALVALLIVCFDGRNLGFRRVWTMVVSATKDTAATTGMTFMVVIGAAVLTYFYVLAGIPAEFAQFVGSLDVPPLVVVALMLLAMIPLGMFLEPISTLLIVVPLTYPIVVDEFGLSGVWFGILLVKMVEIGLLTPPVGLNVFVVVAASESRVTVAQAFRGVVPFIIADLVVVTLLFFFPEIVTAPLSLMTQTS